MQKRTIKGKSHYVYDGIEEFLEHNPNKNVVFDWRKADEGDWVLSDDDGVVQLLKVSKSVKHPGDRKNYKYANGWVRTIVGSFLNKRVNERKKVTRKEREFATNIVVGMGAVEAYKNAYTELSNNKARKKATILLKQERVMKEIEKSVLDVAKGLGIDHEYILGKLKGLADYSEDDNIILQSAKELGKIVGTSGATVKQREVGLLGVFQGFSPDELEGATRDQKQIEDGE